MPISLPRMLTDVKWDKKTLGSLAAAAITVVLAVYMIGRVTFLAPASPGELSRVRGAVCSETGEVFEDYKVADGLAMPWKNPKTGKNTLYQAERCFWTKDGKAKTKPTLVLANEIVGKPGSATCPDCGRRVTVHNPTPPIELMAEAAKAGR